MIGKMAIVGDGDSITVFKAAGVAAFPAENEGKAREILRKIAKEYKIIFLTDVDGYYQDFEDKDSLVSQMKLVEVKELLASGQVSTGMIPKLENSFNALRSGASGVTIKHSDDLLKPDAGTKLSL